MSESKQQDSSNTPQKLPPAVSSSSSTPAQSSASKAQQAKGAHLTPLKVASSDKNLDVDDTLFTESFVRKLSPRSNEACRLLGVLPDELVLRSYENFHEHGISPNIQKLRYQDYEQMRQETIAMVREERATLIAQGWSEAISPSAKLKIQQATLKAMMLPSPEGHHRNGSNSASPARSESASNRRNSNPPAPPKAMIKSATTGQLIDSTQHAHPSVLPHLLPEEILLEQEQDRLRKTMMRQNKEIESMMAYELKVAQMLAKQEQKLEVRRQKEIAAAEQRREERYRQAEKRRLWELQKLEEEEKMKAANAQSMARLNAQEQKHAEEMMQKDAERRREANKRAAERRQKKMELEMRAAQNLQRNFEMARERERDMEERDRRRREALEEKRIRLAAEHEQQKELAQQRVAQVLQTNAATLEEKRSELQRKMDEMESRLRQFEDLKHQMANEKAEEIRQKEERRLAALNDSRSQLDGRIHGILDKKSKHDALKAELESKAKEQHTLKMELRRLNKIRKQANVERLKRMQEYHRSALNEKLSDEARRLRDLEDQKRGLMNKRQMNAINMFKQKEALMKMFADMTSKRNWESLSRLQIKEGTIGEGDEEEDGGDRSHSVSPTRGKSSTMPRPGAASSMLANAARRHNQTSDDDDDGHSRGRSAGSGKPKSASAGGPVNLLDALSGLNKLVKNQKKKDSDVKVERAAARKAPSIDAFLKQQKREDMARSKSQGML